MFIKVVLGSVVIVFTFIGGLTASPLDPVQHLKDFNLNSWIRHYEPARYDSSSLVSRHKRVRRSSGSDRHLPLRLDIRGHDR
ncbi:hypothetical protein JTB14_034297 [Gonioctena quinquepunctata]|nr:hypothetical protein JTB14_034297 [Gonioctena quinquepunctata]